MLSPLKYKFKEQGLCLIIATFKTSGNIVGNSKYSLNEWNYSDTCSYIILYIEFKPLKFLPSFLLLSLHTLLPAPPKTQSDKTQNISIFHF